MQRILLASHGSVGACAAEQVVFTRLKPGDELYHLLVVPDAWDGIPGGAGPNHYAPYEIIGGSVEAQMEEEARQTFARVGEAVRQLGVVFETHLVYGKPVYSLLETVAAISPDYVIAGSARPKHIEGLPSKMITESLMRSMVIPLLIIPYPDERC